MQYTKRLRLTSGFRQDKNIADLIGCLKSNSNDPLLKNLHLPTDAGKYIQLVPIKENM